MVEKGKTGTTTKTTLSMKELAKIAALFGAIMTALMTTLTWIHAEMTIPQILNKTAAQIEKAIDRHSNGKHKEAVGISEFRLWTEQREKAVQQFGDQVIRRLEQIETELRKR